MNRGKTGEPFHYPETFVLMLGYAKVYFHLPYRQKQKVSSKAMQVIEFHPSSSFQYNKQKNKQVEMLG